MTLKEAIDAAYFHADNRGPVGWAMNFANSLEESGFVIVPKEATGEMNQRGMAAIADAMEEGDILTPGEVFTNMLAARPKAQP